MTATPGGDTISVTGGDLAAAAASCTVTVDVVGAAPGAYVNGPANVTTSLHPPAEAGFEVVSPSLSLEKSVDATSLVVGSTATYTLVATNTTRTADGDAAAGISLTGVTIADTEFQGASGLALSCDKASPVTLAAGESLTCTAPYTVTQADLDRGTLNNTATATGTTATAATLTATDTAHLTGERRHELALTKTADPLDIDGDAVMGAGDQIQYGFEVRNLGNVTVDALSVEDRLLTERGIAVACDHGTLAPGQASRCSAPRYTITDADAAAGKVTNTALAHATSPLGPVSSEPDTVVVPLSPHAVTVEIEKVGLGASPGDRTRLEGAGFALTPISDASAAGAATVALREVETGLFRAEDLTPVTTGSRRPAPPTATACSRTPWPSPSTPT